MNLLKCKVVVGLLVYLYLFLMFSSSEAKAPESTYNSVKSEASDKQADEEAYNYIKILPSDSEEEVVQKAAHVVPSERQMLWQELEFITFVHFGVNTFTGREWGTGFEDPELFQPKKTDTDQWCRAMKAAGMKMVVLTAKHHDGFCLWQTRYTKHSVASSSWREGEGDVMGDLSKSCKKYGLKLGVYLSPADLYQIESKDGLYGNLSKYSERVIPRPVAGRPFNDKRTFRYVVDDYNEYFMNQLFELLTEYGPIHEVWFDGAHPKRKGGQKYTHNQWFELIRELAPEAVIFGKGPDVRWCGNEAGATRESEWSVIPIEGTIEQWRWPDMTNQDLGSLGKIMEIGEKGGFLHWYPAETNTSIRHGWFWRDEKQHVKSVEHILDIWYRSVGGNTVFLLNIPPNREGLFAERDVKVLTEVGQVLRGTFETDLSRGAAATASVTCSEDKYNAECILDGDTSTCWKGPDGEEKADLTVQLKGEKVFNRIVIQEQIRDYGQRIKAFAIEAWVEDQWQQIASGTTVGYKRICRTDTVLTDKIRLRILDSRVCPTISEFALYKGPTFLSGPEITRSKDGIVKIVSSVAAEIRYTLDGSEPSEDSPIYKGPFAFAHEGVVKVKAFIAETDEESEIAEAEFGICKGKWKVVFVDSEEKGGNEAAINAIDDDPETIWHTEWRSSSKGHPHEIQIELGEVVELAGFTYLPRGGGLNGTILKYEFYVSKDGKDWGQAVSSGEFSNIKNNPVLQTKRFSEVVTGRFIRLVALSEVNGQVWTSAAEIGVVLADI
jgi:alpha-L-fucosidase